MREAIVLEDTKYLGQLDLIHMLNEQASYIKELEAKVQLLETRLILSTSTIMMLRKEHD